MTRIGVRVLKGDLSEFLRRAGEGEWIVITHRGRPVALPAPFAQDAPARGAWEFVAAGRASWSGGKPRGSQRPPRLKGNRSAEIVLEDRR